MKARWRKAKQAFYKHRAAMRATRCGDPTCNRRLAEEIAISHGIVGVELTCFVELGRRESNFNEEADNPGSDAYGFAQALPGSKYPPAGRPEAPNGWRKAKAQILWMLQYLATRYGTPCNAAAFHTANNWY
jgi:hypothetical protein